MDKEGDKNFLSTNINTHIYIQMFFFLSYNCSSKYFYDICKKKKKIESNYKTKCSNINQFFLSCKEILVHRV